MGVYIKGVTKAQLMKVIINSTEFMPDEFGVVEVKIPHGDLVDRDEIDVLTYEDADGFHTETSAPIVIEAEGE